MFACDVYMPSFALPFKMDTYYYYMNIMYKQFNPNLSSSQNCKYSKVKYIGCPKYNHTLRNRYILIICLCCFRITNLSEYLSKYKSKMDNVKKKLESGNSSIQIQVSRLILILFSTFIQGLV